MSITTGITNLQPLIFKSADISKFCYDKHLHVFYFFLRNKIKSFIVKYIIEKKKLFEVMLNFDVDLILIFL